MKKILLSLCALATAGVSIAQTISNAGFETWRTGTSGTGPTVSINAPTDWYGFDSLIIAGEEGYLPLLLPGYSPTDLHAQVFQETTIKHGGSSSVKLVSLKQDTLGGLAGGNGFVAGSVSNAQPGLNGAAVTSGDYAHLITYSTPGTTTTLRITTVSAWIEYIPGKDSATGALGTGTDTGSFVVEAISTIAGIDSVVGSAVVNIFSTPSFTQFTATLTYVDTIDLVSSVRITFASGQLFNTIDSSIMYVDDVTMTGVPQLSVPTLKNDLVKVYPNPAVNELFFDAPQTGQFTLELFGINGQLVQTSSLKGHASVDVSQLPEGLYFYAVTNSNGDKVQRGKVSIVR